MHHVCECMCKWHLHACMRCSNQAFSHPSSKRVRGGVLSIFSSNLFLYLIGVFRYPEPESLGAGLHTMRRESPQILSFNLMLQLHLPVTSGLEFRACSQVKSNALCFPICHSPWRPYVHVLEPPGEAVIQAKARFEHFWVPWL